MTKEPTRKKSALVKQAEKFFPEHFAGVLIPEPYPLYPEEPRIVQSYTTYSVCEAPITNLKV